MHSFFISSGNVYIDTGGFHRGVAWQSIVFLFSVLGRRQFVWWVLSGNTAR